jgi:hypothetical protein
VLNSHLTWQVGGRYFVLQQERDIALAQKTTYRGVNLAMGVTYTF